MKKGSVLIESLLFLILSFVLFLIVNSAFSSLMRNQRQIEKGSTELSQIISISNLSYDDLSLINLGETSEYKSTVTGETFRIGNN